LEEKFYCFALFLPLFLPAFEVDKLSILPKVFLAARGA
jgi:hypothetical protein